MTEIAPGGKRLVFPGPGLGGPPREQEMKALDGINRAHQGKPAPLSYHLDWIRHADGSIAGPDTRNALETINADRDVFDLLADELASAADPGAVLEEAVANHKPRPIAPAAFYRSVRSRILMSMPEGTDLAAKARSMGAHRRERQPRAWRR